MITDIIICSTLLVNACAILNFRLKKRSDETNFGVSEPTLEYIPPIFREKVREFLLSLRYFRIFIGIWNIFIMFLMIVFFSA
ncbi:protein SMIM7 homolog isoform X1 [Tubulanus polymorphus]|uniref:protein SMIM7 homolog isoform X1 n=1 Tax=Tubulanus polymorphus TaxID=672921 RepID=UPI003DA62185